MSQSCSVCLLTRILMIHSLICLSLLCCLSIDVSLLLSRSASSRWSLKSLGDTNPSSGLLGWMHIPGSGPEDHWLLQVAVLRFSASSRLFAARRAPAWTPAWSEHPHAIPPLTPFPDFFPTWGVVEEKVVRKNLLKVELWGGTGRYEVAPEMYDPYLFFCRASPSLECQLRQK